MGSPLGFYATFDHDADMREKVRTKDRGVNIFKDSCSEVPAYAAAASIIPKDSLGELLTGLIALLDDDAASVRRAALASLLKMCEARARLAMIGQESWRDVEKGKRPTNSGVATMVARK